MSDTPRDGNWIDQWGSCKVCGGEIPDGHTEHCDIYKLELDLAIATEVAEKQTETIRVLEKDLYTVLRRCEKQRVISRL